MDSCIGALNAEKDNNLNDKNYFKLYVFKEVIDCVVMQTCFRFIQSFSKAHHLKSKEIGRLTDKNEKIVLDFFSAWQDLTGVWVPVTPSGQEFAISFDDRINSFRPFMGWEIKKRSNTN